MNLDSLLMHADLARKDEREAGVAHPADPTTGGESPHNEGRTMTNNVKGLCLLYTSPSPRD